MCASSRCSLVKNALFAGFGGFGHCWAYCLTCNVVILYYLIYILQQTALASRLQYSAWCLGQEDIRIQKRQKDALQHVCT